LRHLARSVVKRARGLAREAQRVLASKRMNSDSGFSAGLAIGLLVVVVVVLVLLATIPIGSGADAKPFINIRF